MSVELNVVGMRCGAPNGGLSCAYCYENPIVSKGFKPLPQVYSGAVKKALQDTLGPEARKQRQSFSLFGGEPLLAPLEVLEDLWAFGLEEYGRNGVQTSGRPIREEHWPLFHKYKVCVSFSIDGPGELNDARWAGTLERTRKTTEHSIACLRRAMREKLNVGLIVTLGRHNASRERLPRLLEWFSELDVAHGLYGVGLHLLQHERRADSLALTPFENLEALLRIRAHEVHELKRLKFDLFRDILALLRGEDTWEWRDGSPGGVGCVWNACDPMTTPAVEGVEPDGARSLCPRVHDSPVEWTPGPRGAVVRQLVLRATPQEQGGCQGCRQLITCKGHCPGTAIDGDWRKRSRDCPTWKGLLEHFEEVLLMAGEKPVTLRDDRDAIEARMAEWWVAGRAVRLKTVLAGQRPGPGSSCSGNHDDHKDHRDHKDHDDLGPALAGLAGGESV